MSFSYDVKDYIIKAQYKNVCCRRALLQGAFAAKGYSEDENIASINFEKKDIIDFVSRLVKEFYGKEMITSSLPRGGRGKKNTFFGKAMAKYISSINDGNIDFNQKCPLCLSSFLKGVFLASGRVSNPEKQFCLEFSLGNRSESFMEYFAELGFDFKINERKSECVLYTKNSSVIEDFFALAELNDIAYTFMNIKIANEFLNNANRLRNFDTVNISKAVDAANSQYQLIKKLHDNELMGLLPDELRDTAKLRFENPDMSLSQLARVSIPPISKSGILHRMKKIMSGVGGKIRYLEGRFLYERFCSSSFAQ